LGRAGKGGLIVKALIIGLAIALVASIVLNVAVRRGAVVRPPLEYFPDMVRTVRYNAFEANPNFPDGATLRVPPAGTIPRGMLPVASEPTATPEGDPVNPFTLDDATVLERGASMFNTFCVPCHGATGEGDGLVVQRGFPKPPSLLGEETRSIADAQLFTLITEGFGTMPSYAAQMAREDRWKAIVYLRKLQNDRQSASGAR
jgi:mono/diheme cytochrome c family protein